MKQRSIRVLIVDDHPIVRKGLSATIEPEPGMEVVGSAGTGPEALRLFHETKPDITIMDLTLTPEMTGLQAMQTIRRECPDARIIALSAHHGAEAVYRAMQAGARTFLLKATLGDDLIAAIREVHAGGRPIPSPIASQLADRMNQPALTPRELDVLELMAKGLRNKEIGAQLGITDATTQGHVKSILAKLSVHDRTEAVTAAIRREIIHLD
ncbi:MAG TPA: response regulator transcription factor [Bryobacteraceae bacterium]|nr:response regulator transcription factor [Bryobacteraceae bacterium]